MFNEAIQKKIAEALEQQMMNTLLGNMNPGTGSGRSMQQQQPPRTKTCYECGNPGHYKNDPNCPKVIEQQQKASAFDRLMQHQLPQQATALDKLYPQFHQVQQVQAPQPPPPPAPPPPAPPPPEIDKKLDTVLSQVQQLANALASDRVILRRAEQSQAAFEGTTAIALKEVTKQLAEVTSELKHYKMVQVNHAQTLGKIENTLGTSWEAAIRSQAAAKPSGRRAPASAPPARRAKSARPSVDPVSVGNTDDEDDEADAEAADELTRQLGEDDGEDREETPDTGAAGRRRVPSRRSR